MRLVAVACLLFAQIISVSSVFGQDKENDFDKSIFYSTMRGNNEEAVNKQLTLIKSVNIAEKLAYEGALLMKLAGFVGGAKKKLDMFKDGHRKLESVINKDSLNTELRFLRLMIQEHAPGILGYKGEIQKDRLYIKNNFKKLSPVVQEAVTDYRKESKILKPGEL